MPIIIIFGLIVIVPIFLAFIIIGIQEGASELIVIGVVSLICPFAGLAFFLCYGIKITSKRIYVLFCHTAKTFRLENINYIKIVFSNNSIHGEIKPFRQKPYFFEFSDFVLSPSSVLSRFLVVKVKITKEISDKMISKLSLCDKVRIESHFDN